MPVAVSACAAALRKVCEDLPNLSNEPSNVAGLLCIGEVVFRLYLKEAELLDYNINIEVMYIHPLLWNKML